MANLLDRAELYNRIESEQFSKLSRLRITNLVAASIKKLPEEYQKRAHFDSDTVNMSVRGNSELISILVDELILNALRYSSKDVYISLHKASEHLVIRIEDFGRGLPESAQSRIGEPFVSRPKLSRKLPENYTPTGMGLAIAWAIVQKHNAGLTLLTGKSGTTAIITLDIV
jgi:two-component system OmpR family sensor kinase